MTTGNNAKRIIAGAIGVILILTVLEFPAPIGFETRPQTNVSLAWLALFVVSVISEFVALATIFKRPAFGAKFGIVAGVLNILQVIADQAHLMQPEVAPWGYLLLEDAAAVASFVLIYFSWKMIASLKMHR